MTNYRIVSDIIILLFNDGDEGYDFNDIEILVTFWVWSFPTLLIVTSLSSKLVIHTSILVANNILQTSCWRWEMLMTVFNIFDCFGKFIRLSWRMCGTINFGTTLCSVKILYWIVPNIQTPYHTLFWLADHLVSSWRPMSRNGFPIIMWNPI